jgi:hypothetical protein
MASLKKLRGLLLNPINWWAGNQKFKPAHEQSGWQRGKEDAIRAAKDGRLFGLATTVATVALPAAVGFATTKLSPGVQILCIVAAALAGYLLTPVVWWLGAAITAPMRQRNELRTALSAAGTSADECIERLNAQLRAGSEILEAWPTPAPSGPGAASQALVDAEQAAMVAPWESETYFWLACAPNHRERFRLDVAFGPEWRQEYPGEMSERALLRRRLHRLSEIVDRLTQST